MILIIYMNYSNSYNSKMDKLLLIKFGYNQKDLDKLHNNDIDYI